jgi:hypothetical protein
MDQHLIPPAINLLMRRRFLVLYSQFRGSYRPYFQFLTRNYSRNLLDCLGSVTGSVDASTKPIFISRESSILSREEDLSELALRPVTCGTSDADAERLLSSSATAGLQGRASAYRPWKHASENGSSSDASPGEFGSDGRRR